MMIIDFVVQLNTASIEDSRYWVVLGGGGNIVDSFRIIKL